MEEMKSLSARKAQKGKAGLNKTTMTVCPFPLMVKHPRVTENEESTAVRMGVSEHRHNWHELGSPALAVNGRDGA